MLLLAKVALFISSARGYIGLFARLEWGDDVKIVFFRMLI